MARYLGLDLSTQSLTGLIIEAQTGTVTLESTVVFGDDLPEFNSPQGVLAHDNPLIRHSDPAMWAAALDLLFSRMKRQNAPLNQIAGICGSGQQHGTVYLSKPMPPAPEAESSLADMVRDILSRPTSPIWMDSSTSAECREINAALGGADEVRRRTGSSAVERFSGPQIRRYAKVDPEGYADTHTIHLVSSFLCSLLIGNDAPIDRGDGAGMNLMNLTTGTWDPDLLEATAPHLEAKLPPVVPSHTIAGTLSDYLVQTYGFAPDTPVAVWSGDNPNSLIGVGGWKPGTAVISLGTSDTMFAAMREPRVDTDGYGHVFGNPAGGFMSLICFKNGSLAREEVKNRYDLSWHDFDVTAFEKTPPGNDGNLMLPYYIPEITPLVLEEGVVLQGTETFETGDAPWAMVRAIVEAQAMSMKLHSAWIGPPPRALRVTGGASRSDGICRVLADVFNATVDRLDVGNSAALGSAMRAAQAVGKHSWADLTDMFCVCRADRQVLPRKHHVDVYGGLLQTYAGLEQAHLEALRKERPT